MLTFYLHVVMVTIIIIIIRNIYAKSLKEQNSRMNKNS